MGSRKGKKIYLIVLFVDDRYVDVINEVGYFMISWRIICGIYMFIYIVFNCVLWREYV